MAAVKAKTIEAQEKNVVLPVYMQPNSWRVEIDEFLGDTMKTNLFLLALEQMQEDGLGTLDGIHSFPREHWNGVKGRLPKEYTGGEVHKPDPNNPDSYCRHGSIVFPTWHRAYVYQFEVPTLKQAVQNQMRKIAEQFPIGRDRDRYRNAAIGFRLPYWDPFMPRNPVPKPQNGKVDEMIWGLPKILSHPKVFVRKPKNPKELVEINNPLHHYTFPADEDYVKAKEKATAKDTNTKMGDRNKIKWGASGVTLFKDPETGRLITTRSPNENGQSLDDLNAKIQKQAQNSSTKVWHMLNPDSEGSMVNPNLEDSKAMLGDDKQRNKSRTWESFSNHTESRTNDVVSIESWHDGIHFLVGQGEGAVGHMTRPQVAGFDPIFWLHHCNIDRIFALFQALYPDTWVARTGEVNATSDLYPFPKDTGKFYNSDDLRDWKKVGFAVPGNTELNEETRELIKQYVRDNYYWATDGVYPPESLKYPRDFSNVEALYGKDAGTQAPKVTFDAIEVVPVAGQAPEAKLVEKTIVLSGDEDVVTTIIDTAAAAAAQVENEKNFPEGALQDVEAPGPTKMVVWNAHVRVKKYAFDGSFGIHLFIGRVNDQKSATFMTRGNEVGFSGIFTSSEAAECANCEVQRAADVIYVDVIPITSTLVDYLDANPKSGGLIQEGEIKTIPNLQPESLVPFLKEHLQWRVVDPASTLIDGVQQIKDSGLEIKVVHRIFETPTDENKLGAYSEPVLHQEITEGKLGGYGYHG